MTTAPTSTARAAFARAREVLAGFRAQPGDRPAVDAAGAPSRTPPPPASAPAPPDPRTARERVEQALEAAGRADALGAIVAVDPDAALAEADARDRTPPPARGPLHGMPVTVKDVIDVAGLPTRAGSAAYLAHPDLDAEAVARIRTAGAVVLGKVATHEFAMGVTTPQARNPHDPTRIPGGSSGGSGIAVATGFGD
ncbi:MAG: amidase family protein, partial [Thermoleophilia bacterium]